MIYIEKSKIDNVNNKINVPKYENPPMLLLVLETFRRLITC